MNQVENALGDMQSLDLLEEKIKALELKVFGADMMKSQDDPAGETINVVDSLTQSRTVMGTAISSHDKIGKMVTRMEELDAVLDPAFETNTLNNSSKIEMLLLMYDDLHDMIAQLRCVRDSADIVNSEQIRAIPKVEDRLNALTKTMYENKAKVENNNESVQSLLTSYNRVINSFTRTFAQFDEIITELEIASDIKMNVE